MSRPLRVLSLYEGFFAGGARILHTDVVAGLHERGTQRHSILSIASEARREASVQPMDADPRYLRLLRAGVGAVTLGRAAGAEPPDRHSYTDAEIEVAAEAVHRADVILSLKEQPLGLLLALHDRGLMPDVPVAACLHRSDPTHSGPALGWLAEASDTGLLTSTISCADSTSDAYAQSHSRNTLRSVIRNGIDTERFRPGSAAEMSQTRSRLAIPADAPVIVFAARFDAMKNPGLFLRAVGAHAQQHPETHYLLCGAGMRWENEGFRTLIEDSEVAPGVLLHPLGIRDDMPSIYQIADIVALTSAFGEASPLCLMEGAACGATPVTTSVGDSARDVESIGVVTSHRELDIAAAWEDVLSRRGQFRRAALDSRPRLGRERMIDEYGATIRGLVASRRIAA